MPSASRSSVAVSVSASQPIKLIKSVTSLVFEKDTDIVCVFYEKRRLKIGPCGGSVLFLLLDFHVQ